MNKRNTKKILSKMIKSLPNEVDVDDYCFCCAKEFDYGAKTYKGLNLYFYNMIKKDTIYLTTIQNYEKLYW